MSGFHRGSATVLGCIRDQIRDLQGHSTLVESRRCPAHYGILVSHSWDPDKHDLADYHKDEHTGRAMAMNQVEWFAKKVATQNYHSVRL